MVITLVNPKVTIRPATAEDLPNIARIQAATREASQWEPAGYLQYECFVAELDETICGFIVLRQTAPDEREVLNLAVDPSARRRGVARKLIETAVFAQKCTCFLEVRASNAAAQALYLALGFRVAGRRPQYYHDPCEEAVVMKIDS